jgi:hypothetical protein
LFEERPSQGDLSMVGSTSWAELLYAFRLARYGVRFYD